MMDSLRHPTAYLLTIPDAGEIVDALFLSFAQMAVALLWVASLALGVMVCSTHSDF